MQDSTLLNPRTIGNNLVRIVCLPVAVCLPTDLRLNAMTITKTRQRDRSGAREQPVDALALKPVSAELSLV